jgi:dUTP pyrophosphatase
MGNTLVFIAEVIRQPFKRTDKSAGFDLKSDVAFDIHPFDQITVGTGVRVSIPSGYYGQILDKSSFSTKNGLFTVAGVIDEDYTGEIKVVLFNPTPNLKSIAKDVAIAQLVVVPIFNGSVLQVDPPSAEGWTKPTARGPSGFGLSDTANLPNGIVRRR